MNGNEENVLLQLTENRLLPQNSPRAFSSPPQPHMCVQDICVYKGIERTCFINILSWNKIGPPPQPGAPIPVYGGIEVPLTNRSLLFTKQENKTEKFVAFAVVVNPNVLKVHGKNAVNQVDRDFLMDIVLNFIEAKNENLRFSRKITPLQDRDLTGELKEIWTLIQAKRARDKMQSLPSGTLRDENSCPGPPPVPLSSYNTDTSAIGGEQDGASVLSGSPVDQPTLGHGQ